MAAKPVKAYRQGVHKNDARDARAIAEAASRSHVGAVRVKSERSQIVQGLVRMRMRGFGGSIAVSGEARRG
jgi:transposase